jgi:hypothetical protein
MAFLTGSCALAVGCQLVILNPLAHRARASLCSSSADRYSTFPSRLATSGS